MDSWWRELGDLNDEQRNVIKLPAEGSFLVNGPPGSGKTNLLLLRANYLVV
jgi:superfamily I DNA/RNA helicase